MIKYIKILLLLIYATTIQAQSLDSLVSLAIKNHPSMKVADLKIKQQELLRNSGFELEKTDFYYTGQALGYENDNDQHDFGVSQTFSLPKVYQAKNNLINAQIDLVKQEKKVTEIEIRKVVEVAYWQLIAVNEQVLNYQQLDATFQEFIAFAKLRVEVGEANPLELANIKNEYLRLNQTVLQIKKQRELKQRFLMFLIKKTNSINIENQAFQLLEINVLTKANMDNQPMIQYLQQQKVIAERQITIAENKLSPDFNVGYASQVFNGQAGLNLFQVGVSVPLFKKSQEKQIEATKLETAVISAKSEAEAFRLNLQFEQLIQEQYHIKYQLDGNSLLLKNLTETLPISKLAYENGEISYFEHLQLLKQIAETTTIEIQLKQQYNEAILNLKYLGF
jgi:cobalt-zinc-cadmium resistance protein CzcA